VPAALSVSALEKSYGSVRALSGVDLEVGEGELVGLLGPNGAGKSTLVKIACGLVTPTAGAAAARSCSSCTRSSRIPRAGRPSVASCSSSWASLTPAGAGSAR
jgi:ABC-type sugar transport system ATPase subunit